MRIILGAVVSVQPFSPGMAWNWMQLTSGLRRLGHDVYYIEEVEPHWCVDDQGRPCPLADSVNREVFRSVMQRFGLTDRAWQIDTDGETVEPGTMDVLIEEIEDADLLINMSGHIKYEAVLSAARRRAYVDQDPVYTQLWRAEYGEDLNLGQHDVFFSVGLNIGTARTPVPDCGIQWQPMLPLVVLDDWRPEADTACSRFTTIASWGGFGSVQYDGEWYASKYEEFMRYAELPRKVDQSFEVAMRRYRDEEEGIQLLRSCGWHVFDSSGVFDLDGYQTYIARSRAEIGIAKNAYVKSNSGWFSDRAAHYLASGKPVLAQSTGFEEHLPAGRGLLTFANLKEAVGGVEAINRDYVGHCRAAREFAREFLDYRKVLPAVLEHACSSEPQEARL